MKKSLAQLKRDAKAGSLVCEMVEHYGKTGDEIPERLRGKRPVVGANTVVIFFQNADGKKCELRIERASLMDYDDDSITVYRPGLRIPTTEEKSVLEGWKKIEETKEFQEQAKTDFLTDGNSTYWQKKCFFEDKGFPWMAGWGGMYEYGKAYEPNNGMVRDMNVLGEVTIKYRICH